MQPVPGPETDPQLIRAELARLLAWPGLKSAAQLSKLLAYVVEAALEGRKNELKESVLGIEVYSIGGHDPQTDSRVRTYARRLRDKLAEYYAGPGKDDPLEIAMPVGGYVPVFIGRAPAGQLAEVEGTGVKSDSQALDELPPARKPKKLRRITLGAALSLLVVFFPWSLWFQPLAANVAPLTSDGLLFTPDLITDGSWIYCLRTVIRDEHVPVRIPVTGGEPVRVALPPGDWRFFDRDQLGNFLLGRREPGEDYSLWTWRPGAPPILFNQRHVDYAVWMDRGRVAAIEWRDHQAATQRILFLSPAGIERSIPIPGEAEWPRFSLRHAALRFTLIDPKSETPSIWQVQVPSGDPEPVPGLPQGAFRGAWSRDGSIFAFSVGRNHLVDNGDIWAIDERPLRRHTPTKLTFGVLDFDSVAFGPDRRRIFALGRKQHNQIVAYNSSERAFLPILGGTDAMEANFSPDGKWIAYENSTDGALYATRANGAPAQAPQLPPRIKLTPPGMRATGPHWSPDGTRIAFAGIVGGKWRIYTVPAIGGAPTMLADHGEDQGIPSWSSDGKKIIFGDLLRRKAQREMSIHVLDLETAAITELPESKGLWSPRWSPEGRYILATTPDFRELRLFDVSLQRWRTLLRGSWIDWVEWSRDSQCINFAGNVETTGPAKLAMEWVYRLSLKTERPEHLLNLNAFHSAEPNWYGIAPDGSPLALERISSVDLYELLVK